MESFWFLKLLHLKINTFIIVDTNTRSALLLKSTGKRLNLTVFFWVHTYYYIHMYVCMYIWLYIFHHRLNVQYLLGICFVRKNDKENEKKNTKKGFHRNLFTNTRMLKYLSPAIRARLNRKVFWNNLHKKALKIRKRMLK